MPYPFICLIFGGVVFVAAQYLQEAFVQGLADSLFSMARTFG